MGQVRVPQGMMGRPGSQMGRETMHIQGAPTMMMPGGPGMVPGGPAGQGPNMRPKSNTHIVQPAPAPLTGQDSMGKGFFSPSVVLTVLLLTLYRYSGTSLLGPPKI